MLIYRNFRIVNNKSKYFWTKKIIKLSRIKILKDHRDYMKISNLAIKFRSNKTLKLALKN